MTSEAKQQSLPFVKDCETSKIEVVLLALPVVWKREGGGRFAWTR